MNQWAKQAFSELMEKLSVTSDRIGAGYPHTCSENKYDNVTASWWTNGFWPGMLWLAYQETKENKYAELAKKIEVMLDETLEGYYELHHDVGFMWLFTSVAQYRINQNEESKRRALKAASVLASRFNVQGRFIRAWNGKDDEKQPPIAGWAIIDCMMNIPLLFWASEITEDPRFRHVACAHADTVLKEFIREDGSSCHIVCFDPETGERICSLGGQGYAPDSAWSRGCSWAIYGMAMAYAYTKDSRYLESAKKSAKYFMEAMKETEVPLWDFCVPDSEHAPQDASAAGIAACGMLEIEKLTRESVYREWAERLLRGLHEYCFSSDLHYDGMILHATGNKSADLNVDVSLIYGDYYYMEGLLRLLGRDRLF